MAGVIGLFENAITSVYHRLRRLAHRLYGGPSRFQPRVALILLCVLPWVGRFIIPFFLIECLSNTLDHVFFLNHVYVSPIFPLLNS